MEEGEVEGAARGRREVAKEPVARGWVQEDVGDVVEKEAKEAIERGDVRCRRSRRRRTLIAMLKILSVLSSSRERGHVPLAPFAIHCLSQENMIHLLFVAVLGATAVAMRPMGHNSGATAEVMVYSSNDARARQVSPCTWTAPDGNYYDFTELVRTGTSDDYLVSIPHSDFAMLVNLCANALKVPARCAAKSTAQASVGFQWNTKEPNTCWELGELSTAQWSYIDDKSPDKGVEIMYAGGTPCSKGVRMLHYHMVCAGTKLGNDKPSFAWESPTCHYHVVWPTALACKGHHKFSMWTFVEDWFLFILFAAVVGSLFISFRRQQTDGTPVQETLTDLATTAFATATERGSDFVTSIQSRVGGGVGGGTANRHSVSGSSSSGDFGAGVMSPMPMGGDAL